MKTHNKHTRIIYLVLAGIMILVLAGCSDGSSISGGDKPQEVISDLSREDMADFPLEELAGLAEGNSAFALDLYQQLASGEGNLFYSPYSISSALAMTYAGAEGNTAQEMAEVFHFMEDEDQLHAGFNALAQYLEGLAEMEIQDDIGEPFQLNIANSIWGQKDFHFEEDFLDTLAVNYGAGLRLLDYIQAPEESRQTINQWVSDQTKEKIQDLIPQGAIDSDTRLVLSNAIYFKATWMEPFGEN
ncbi:MAG: serpin family protein, partial [Anaerolineales bacterium]